MYLILNTSYKVKMRRRIILILLCITLVAIAFTGCSQGKGSDKDINATITPAAGEEDAGYNTEDNSDAGNSGVTDTPENTDNQSISYAYEQELNIIDDNYRNYYEIFVYSFSDSDGDGIGDMNGIISKLDYIKDMGFNGIWLMPIMPSPTYHKYDVSDYYSIDPKYGTLEDFQNLITECHNRGIRLIIDYVFNHTSTRHPWFQDAVNYLKTLEEGQEPDLTQCPSVAYYYFTKEKKGNSYYKAGGTDWYYEGVFWDQMPDLALGNQELRAELEKNAKFWLDMGVDGFRLDAVKEYYTGDTGKNIEVLQWFSDYVSSVNPEAFVVGECWDTAGTIASYYGSGLTSIFNYPLAQYNGLIVSAVRRLGTSSAKTLAASLVDLDSIYAAKNPDYIDSPFLSNHDNTRISAQCVNNEDQMKLAAGVLLTLKGSPFVYYGEEIGMNSKGDKDENKRLPMNWSLTDTAGITKAPMGADQVEQKFAPLDEQLANPLSIANYYKRALRIRNENPEIARGDFSLIDELTSQDVFAIRKSYEGSELVLVYNLGKEATTIDLEALGLASMSIRGYMTVDGSEVTLVEGGLNMPYYSIVVLK